MRVLLSPLPISLVSSVVLVLLWMTPDLGYAQEPPVQAPPIDGYDDWYVGVTFHTGPSFPVGDSRFAVEAGDEFTIAAVTGLDLIVDLGVHFELVGSVSQQMPALEEELFRQTYGVTETDALSTSMTQASLKARVFPLSWWVFRPFVGVGVSSVRMYVGESTNSSAGCLREAPEGEEGECATPWLAAHYEGLSLLMSAGLRFDVLGGWIDRKELRSDASILVPLFLELVYHRTSWERFEADRAADDGTTYHQEKDPSDLSLDHLTLLFSFGMLF